MAMCVYMRMSLESEVAVLHGTYTAVAVLHSTYTAVAVLHARCTRHAHAH